MPMEITARDALIVVDMQNDFMPGGALAVQAGDQIVPLINRLLDIFPTRVLTRDWHPPDHLSFAANPLFIDQSWPAHCVQNTPGAEFHPQLRQQLADTIVSKGTHAGQEAYSGFQSTELEGWLKQRGVERVFVAGVATDYCVKSTALDALTAGFDACLIRDAVRGVDNPPGSEAAAVSAMLKAGVNSIESREILPA
ncbi:nicotinamidase [candidate division FCPU426 bacterium]|nr:nicotinamidase [candidate division FCPU426 bacterium]